MSSSEIDYFDFLSDSDDKCSDCDNSDYECLEHYDPYIDYHSRRSTIKDKFYTPYSIKTYEEDKSMLTILNLWVEDIKVHPESKKNRTLLVKLSEEDRSIIVSEIIKYMNLLNIQQTNKKYKTYTIDSVPEYYLLNTFFSRKSNIYNSILSRYINITIINLDIKNNNNKKILFFDILLEDSDIEYE